MKQSEVSDHRCNTVRFLHKAEQYRPFAQQAFDEFDNKKNHLDVLIPKT